MPTYRITNRSESKSSSNSILPRNLSPEFDGEAQLEQKQNGNILNLLYRYVFDRHTGVLINCSLLDPLWGYTKERNDSSKITTVFQRYTTDCDYKNEDKTKCEYDYWVRVSFLVLVEGFFY